MSGNEILKAEKLYMFTISHRCQYYLCYTKVQVNEMKELVLSLLANIASELVLSSFSGNFTRLNLSFSVRHLMTYPSNVKDFHYIVI